MIRVDHLFEHSLFFSNVSNQRLSHSNLSIKEPSSVLNLSVYSKYDEGDFIDQLNNIWSADSILTECNHCNITQYAVEEPLMEGLALAAAKYVLYRPVLAVAIEFFRIYPKDTSDEVKWSQLASVKVVVDDILQWLVMSTDILTIAPESLQLASLKRISAAILMATTLFNCILNDSSNSIDVQVQEHNFSNLVIVLRESFYYLESSLFLCENIRSIEQRKKPIMKWLKSILRPTDVREDVKRGLSRFCAGSREWLHRDVLHWMNHELELSQEQEQGRDKCHMGGKLFLLKMLPGMGKTAFCASLAGRLPGWNNKLLGAIFFSAQDRRTYDPRSFIRNLAFQIADRFPELQEDMEIAVKSVTPMEDCELAVLCNILVIEPLVRLRANNGVAKDYSGDGAPTASDNKQTNMLLVIDGFDQSGLASGGSAELLDVLAMLLRNLPLWIKVLISSCPDQGLEDRLQMFRPMVMVEDDPRLYGDLHAFVRSQLTGLHNSVLLSTDAGEIVSQELKPDELDRLVCTLVERSSGSFLYFALLAAALRKELSGAGIKVARSGGIDHEYGAAEAVEALHVVISRQGSGISNGLGSMLYAFFTDLRTKFVARFDPLCMLNDTYFYSHCMKLLHVVLFSQQPLHRRNVQRIIAINDDDMDYLCQELHFLFPVEQDHFVNAHAAVVSWLQDAFTNTMFFVDKRRGHLLLANSLLYDFQDDFTHGNEEDLAEQGKMCSNTLTEIHSYALYYLADHCDVITALAAPITDSSVVTSDDEFMSGSVLGVNGGENSWKPTTTLHLMFNLRYIQAVVKRCGLTQILTQMYSRCTNPRWNSATDRAALKAVWTCLNFAKPGIVRGDHNRNNDGSNISVDCNDNCDAEICTQLLARLEPYNFGVSSHPVLAKLLVEATSWLDSRGGYRFLNHVLRAPSSFDRECQLSGHTSVVNTVSLLGHDRIVSACNDKTARVWNIVTMVCVRVLVGHTLWVTGACGLVDGRIATSSCDNSVRIWNFVSGEAEMLLHGHTSDVTCIKPLSVTEVVSGSKDFSVRVWNVFSGRCIHIMKGHESDVTSLCVLSDRRVVSGAKDFTVRIWSADCHGCEKVLRGHQSFVTGVCILAGDVIASSSHDMTVRVWSDAAASIASYEKIYVGHMNSVSSVCAVNEYSIASGSVDTSVPTIRVWNTVTNECDCAILGNDDHSVRSLCVLLDGRLVSCSSNNDLYIWDLTREKYQCGAVVDLESNRSRRRKDFLGLAALSGSSSVRVHGLRSGAASTIHINTSVLSRKINGLPLNHSSRNRAEGANSGAAPSISIVPLVHDKLIAGCGESLLRVCDTNTLKQDYVIDADTACSGSAAGKQAEKLPCTFSSFCVVRSENGDTDGLSEILVTTSSDNLMRRWDIATGKCEGVLLPRNHDASHLSPHNSTIVICAMGDEFVATVCQNLLLSIWNVRTMKQTEEHELEGLAGTGAVSAICSYGEGYYYVVTASADGVLRIWNAKEGDCEQVLSGHKATVTAVCMLRGERIASGSCDKTLRVWKSGSGECITVLVGHIGSVTAVCSLWGDRVVSGSSDSTILVWDPLLGSCLQRFDASASAGQYVVALCELEDGRVASCSSDFILCYWDTVSHLCEFAATDKDNNHLAQKPMEECSDSKPNTLSAAGKEVASFVSDLGAGHTAAITVLHVLDDGQILSGSKDFTIRRWDLTNCLCSQVFRGHKGWVAALCGLGEGRVVSGAHDKKVRIWSSNGTCERTLRGHTFRVVSVRVLHNSDILVSGSHDKSVRVWSVSSGVCQHVLEGHSDWISNIELIADSRIVSVSNEAVCVWDAVTGELQREFQGPKSVLRAVCVLSDGRIITGSNDSICGVRFTIHLWDPISNKITRVHSESVEANESGLTSLFMLPNERFVSVNNGDVVRVWSVQQDEAVCEKQFVFNHSVHLIENDTMSLLCGHVLLEPPPPSYLDGDPCTVAIRTNMNDVNGVTSSILVSATVSGKLHFTKIISGL